MNHDFVINSVSEMSDERRLKSEDSETRDQQHSRPVSGLCDILSLFMNLLFKRSQLGLHDDGLMRK